MSALQESTFILLVCQYIMSAVGPKPDKNNHKWRNILLDFTKHLNAHENTDQYFHKHCMQRPLHYAVYPLCVIGSKLRRCMDSSTIRMCINPPLLTLSSFQYLCHSVISLSVSLLGSASSPLLHPCKVSLPNWLSHSGEDKCPSPLFSSISEEINSTPGPKLGRLLAY